MELIGVRSGAKTIHIFNNENVEIMIMMNFIILYRLLPGVNNIYYCYYISIYIGVLRGGQGGLPPSP